MKAIDQSSMDAWDLYDQSFLIDRRCPLCGAQRMSNPDCTETCSDRKCEFYDIWIKET